MTVKGIAAMFAVGSRWRYMNTAVPEAHRHLRDRRLVRRTQKDLVWDEAGCRTWLTLPPAHAVIEARDGFLSYYCDFENPRPDRTITLERVGPGSC